MSSSQLPIPFSTILNTIPVQGFPAQVRNSVKFPAVQIPTSSPYITQLRSLTSVALPLVLTYESQASEVGADIEWEPPSILLDLYVNSQLIATVPAEFSNTRGLTAPGIQNPSFVGGAYTQFQSPIEITTPTTLALGGHGLLGLSSVAAVAPAKVTLWINAERFAANFEESKNYGPANGSITYDDEIKNANAR